MTEPAPEQPQPPPHEPPHPHAPPQPQPPEPLQPQLAAGAPLPQPQPVAMAPAMRPRTGEVSTSRYLSATHQWLSASRQPGSGGGAQGSQSPIFTRSWSAQARIAATMSKRVGWVTRMSSP